MVSVIPKGNCLEVERAVSGLRAGEQFHWLRSFGIVDGDGQESDKIQDKKQNGIYALSFYSVESIYYHPKIIKCIAERMAQIRGDDPDVLFNMALKAGVQGMSEHTERLSRKFAKKKVRRMITEQIPNDDVLVGGIDLTLKNNATSVLKVRKKELENALDNKDWEKILTMCAAKESNALANISRVLKFPKVHDYEQAVRQLLAKNDGMLEFVRKLFDDLFDQLHS